MTQVIVGEQVAGESAAIRNQLEHLVKYFDKSLFDIGELLYKVRQNHFYTSWGFNTMKEYVTSLNFKERRAHYLTRIVEVMTQVGIAREAYEPLGITKLREITQLDPTATWTNPQTGETTPMREWIAHFVEKGAEYTTTDLKEHIRVLKGLVGENDLVWDNVCYQRIVLDNIIRPARELVRNRIGSVAKDEDGDSIDASDAACEEAIHVEFMNDPANNVLPEEES